MLSAPAEGCSPPGPGRAGPQCPEPPTSSRRSSSPSSLHSASTKRSEALPGQHPGHPAKLGLRRPPAAPHSPRRPSGQIDAAQGGLGRPAGPSGRSGGPSLDAVARPAAPARRARNDLYPRQRLLQFRHRSDPGLLALHPADHGPPHAYPVWARRAAGFAQHGRWALSTEVSSQRLSELPVMVRGSWDARGACGVRLTAPRRCHMPPSPPGTTCRTRLRSTARFGARRLVRRLSRSRDGHRHSGRGPAALQVRRLRAPRQGRV